MVLEALNGGGLVRLIATTAAVSLLSTREAATAATATRATSVACASASAYNQICELVEQIHRWWICTDPPTILFFLVKFNRFNFFIKVYKKVKKNDSK